MPSSPDNPRDNIPLYSPSPESSASQAPPNPLHSPDQPAVRPNPHAAAAQNRSAWDSISRRLMGVGAPPPLGGAHQRGRSLDLGPSHGVYDTPNVRERVRKWQATGGGVITPGENEDVPPIAPATPTPGRRATMFGAPGSDFNLPPANTFQPRERASSSVRGDDLQPPKKIMVGGKEEWDSASEAEKEEKRFRAKSMERERRLKRRRDREKGRGEKKTPAGEDTGKDSDSTPLSTPVKDKDGGVPLDDDGIRVAPLKTRKNRDKEKDNPSMEALSVGDDDGIRVGPIKRARSRRKEKEDRDREAERKEKEEQGKEENKERPKTATSSLFDDDGIRVTPLRTRKHKRHESAPAPIPIDEPSADVMSDTITSPTTGSRKTSTALDSSVMRSETSSRYGSIRRSAKSVRQRKELFEADMEKEKQKRKDFEEMIKRRDEEERQREAEKGRRRDERRKKREALEREDVKLETGSTTSSKKPWVEVDDGIRVSPVPRNRRKKQPINEDTDAADSDAPAEKAEETTKVKPKQVEEEPKKELSEVEKSRLKLAALMGDSPKATEEKPKPKHAEQNAKSAGEKPESKPDEVEKPKLKPVQAAEKPKAKVSKESITKEKDRETKERKTPTSVAEKVEPKRTRSPPKPFRPHKLSKSPSREEATAVPRRKKSPIGARWERKFKSPSPERGSRRNPKEELKGPSPPPLRSIKTEPAKVEKTEKSEKPEKVERERGRQPSKEQLKSRYTDPTAASQAKRKDGSSSPELLPPRRPSRRERRKTMSTSEVVRPSIEELAKQIKHAQSKSAHTTPYTSSESLGSGLKRQRTSRSPIPTVEELVQARRRLRDHSQSRSVSPSDRHRADSPRGRNAEKIVPKLASATSSFFKAIRAEFQTTSARELIPSDSSSSTESEEAPSADDGEGSLVEDERKSEAPISRGRSPSPSPSTSPSPPPSSLPSPPPVEKPPQKERRESAFNAPPLQKAPTAPVPHPPPLKERKDSAASAPPMIETRELDHTPPSDSEAEPETPSEVMAHGRGPEHKSTVMGRLFDQPTPAEELQKQLGDSFKSKTPAQDEPIPVLGETPVLPKPQRRRRTTTAPPRPKSAHSRSGSTGSRTPTSSVVGDGESEHQPSRNTSDASNATVKPLRVGKSTTKHSSEPSHPPPPPPPAEDVDDWYNPDMLTKTPSLKRKVTKTADLMSILSVPRSSKSVRSRTSRHRSDRTRGSYGPIKREVQKATVQDLLNEMAKDEVKYMRELRTLVEDVVPVLFQHVLGRADDDLRRTSSVTSASSGTTGSSTTSRGSRGAFAANPTRPIVDMGISLERLKTMHERLPRHDPEHLLTWATDAKKVYEEYLSVWRMGWQDVVVTMSPETDDEYSEEQARDPHTRKDLEAIHGVRGNVGPASDVTYEGDPRSWAMPGPPPDTPVLEEESVDVAFLLKRPLVRLKVLAKLFKRINMLHNSQLALSLSNSFHALVTMARRKISEEKARIEDEAAATLDVTRVLDMHNLLPRTDIYLDHNRRVRARDAFVMRLYHSSDQLIERNVELILRDPARRHGYSDGEVLITEVGEGITKWLLFPPIPLTQISARTGDGAQEIVVMVRGTDEQFQEWREVMVLGSATAEGFEWVQMLGLQPIPPEGPFGDDVSLGRLDTVIEESYVSSARPAMPSAIPVQPRTKKQPSKATEPALEPPSAPFDYMQPSVESTSDLGSEKVGGKGLGITQNDPASDASALPLPPMDNLPPGTAFAYGNVPFEPIGGSFQIPNLPKDKLVGAHEEFSEEYSVERSPSLHTIAESNERNVGNTPASLRRSRKATKPKKKSSKNMDGMEDSEAEVSSSQHLQPGTFIKRARSVHLDEDEKAEVVANTKQSRNPMDNVPVLTPINTDIPREDVPPPPPPHRSPTKSSQNSSPETSPTDISPPGSPSQVSSTRPFAVRRHTSSPLKHEYAPSSPSDDSASEEDVSDVSAAGVVEEDEESESDSESEVSEDEMSDDVEIYSEEDEGEYPKPTVMIPRRASKLSLSRGPSAAGRDEPKEGVRATSPALSIVPSREPSPEPAESEMTVQAPKQALAPEQQQPMYIPPPGIKFRAYAFIWGTSQWQKLAAEECRVIVSPGNIEAIPCSSPMSTPGSASPVKSSDQSLMTAEPVFAFEIAHGMPVNRGTAVDISIKTPGSSKFNGASLMLRSRSPNECEALYAAIQSNRQSPPPASLEQTPSTTVTSFTSMELSTAPTDATTLVGSIKRGWWGRSKSYRAGGNNSSPSLMSGHSSTSVGSMSSMFSRTRFGKMFKSSPLNSSLASSSDGSSPEPVPIPGLENSQLMMTQMKIRLYKRLNSNKWRDMGLTRLNVLNPPEGHKSTSITGDDKRVVITNKKGTVIMLDTVLGEAAFERVARTGVAFSILIGEGMEEGGSQRGRVKGVGGIGAKTSVYMMRMKSEAEAAYTFSILGKHRY